MSFFSLPYEIRQQIWDLLASEQHIVKITQDQSIHSTRSTILLKICQESRGVASRYFRYLLPQSPTPIRLDIDILEFGTASALRMIALMNERQITNDKELPAISLILCYGIRLATISEFLQSTRHIIIHGIVQWDMEILVRFENLKSCSVMTSEKEYLHLLGARISTESLQEKWERMFQREGRSAPDLLFCSWNDDLPEM
jgi:hypothetical protein